MARKRKTKEVKTALGPLDPLLGGRFQVTITSFVHETSTEHTMVSLINLLREMRDHRDMALRHIWGCLLICREENGEGIDAAKDVIIEKIAAYWDVRVTRKQLEPKINVDWDSIDDLKLPYDAKKLPAIRKKYAVTTPTPEPVEEPSTALEDELESGEFNIE